MGMSRITSLRDSGTLTSPPGASLTSLLPLQAKLLFCDGKRPIARVPHEVAAIKVKAESRAGSLRLLAGRSAWLPSPSLQGAHTWGRWQFSLCRYHFLPLCAADEAPGRRREPAGEPHPEKGRPLEEGPAEGGWHSWCGQEALMRRVSSPWQRKGRPPGQSQPGDRGASGVST